MVVILNVPDSKSNMAYLGIISQRLEFSEMIKILFVCHGKILPNFEKCLYP